MDGAPAAQRVQLLHYMIQLDQDQAQNDLLLAQHIDERRRRRGRRPRRCWVRGWLARRALFGQYEQLMHELEIEDEPSFKNYMRMEPRMFHELGERLTPRLQKMHTNYRN